MHALIVSLALFAQADSGIPPAPAAEFPPNPVPDTLAEMRTWLLTRLIVDQRFDPQKAAETERLINNMDEPRMCSLIAYYKERTEKKDQATREQQVTASQLADDQAKLNLQKAEAYRDHLKREYDRRLLQGYMNQNLLYRNALNTQMMMYGTYPYTMFFPYGGFGGYGYSPYGYGGLGYYGGMGYGGMGYGQMNYGAFGYGAPGFGGPGIYGSPYAGGTGMGMW